MAPPKHETQRSRMAACVTLLKAIDELIVPEADQALLDACSTVKGLFNRVYREDQWDWFSVCGQLGYPSHRMSGVIAHEMSRLRHSIKNSDNILYAATRNALVRLPFRKCLNIFLGKLQIVDEPDGGWVYALSTREFRELLKVGMTTRTVESRVQEINTATGVAIPFGVRRCWRVKNPREAEKIAHAALASFRLRSDREFFRVDFLVASKLLDDAIAASGLEIRTLNALSALA